MFDGPCGWVNFSESINLKLGYPYGAKWIMHYNRGVYEGAIFCGDQVMGKKG